MVSRSIYSSLVCLHIGTVKEHDDRSDGTQC